MTNIPFEKTLMSTLFVDEGAWESVRFVYLFEHWILWTIPYIYAEEIKNTLFSWKIQRINTDNNALRSVLSVFDPAGNGATDGDCSDMVTIDSEVKCNLCNYVSTANENYYWDADIPGSEICISKYYYT